jgi:drug/metabolite transporter (DMT)-like permease
MSSAAQQRRAWIAWFAICLIWGTTYLAIKVAVATVPPLLLGGIRYALASVVMIVVLRLMGRKLPPWRDWPMHMILGFLMIALGNGGVNIGSGYLTSGLTAVLVATSPFWMVSVEALFPGGARILPRQLAGIAVGFIGILLLVWPDISIGGASRRNVLLGVAAVQVAVLGWSIASSFTKRHVVSGDVLGVATLHMLFGGLFMFAGGTVRGEWPHLTFTTSAILAIAYLTVLGSVVAFVAYSYALKHLPIAVVSLYTYVNPVIAVALGILLLNEPFDLRQLLAAAVIVLGILIVRPGKTAQSELEPAA